MKEEQNDSVIVVELIVLGEEKYRERRLSHHQWCLEDRVRRIAEAKRQREEAERKERERIAALEKARVDRLLGEAGALQLADKIREYVTAIEARVMRAPGLVQPEAIARWKTWALAQADRIDPVASGQFMAGLELGTGGPEASAPSSMRSDDVAVGGCSER